MSDRMLMYWEEAASSTAVKVVRMVLILSALSFIFFALVWAYHPGFSGPFLFDDAPNLQSLSLINGDLSWDRLKDYLNTGVAGPGGRPISLLSFLMNATDWPAETWFFKFTNVLIHALNSILVFRITLFVIQRTQGEYANGVLAAGLVSMLWAFSPYHVSTVLYVVQRMAMLSAMFVLLGLILYLKGRVLLEKGERSRFGLFFILTAYAVGAGMGVLSKENAALFVLMVVLMEWIFFQGKGSTQSRVNYAVWGIVAVPAFFLVAVVIVQWPSFLEEYQCCRSFTLGERLLTQARAVGYYLWRYLVPGTDYVGIYGDGFIKSTSLLTPISTLIWALAHTILVTLAVKVRREMPLLSFSILFFYIGHLMESSVVPLELFFEHRNYLPSAFLFASAASFSINKPVVTTLLACVCLSAVLLHEEAKSWADPDEFRVMQVERNPLSEWAAHDLAVWYFNQRDYKRALEVMRSYARRSRPGVEIALKTVLVSCYAKDEMEKDKENLLASPAVHPGKPGSLIKSMDTLGVAIRRGICRQTDFQDLLSFLEIFRKVNENSPKALQAYYAALGVLAFHAGNYTEFRDAVILAVSLYPSAEYTLGICSHLAVIDKKDACACIQHGSHAFVGGVGIQRSIPRWVFGYEEGLHAQADELRAHVCTSK